MKKKKRNKGVFGLPYFLLWDILITVQERS
nr:MAG TPA: Protein of unknown function (DUF3311) [Caudoviricetes sp.]